MKDDARTPSSPPSIVIPPPVTMVAYTTPIPRSWHAYTTRRPDDEKKL